MVDRFIESGLAFFEACNTFISAVISFFSNPMLYISAYGFWVCVFITIIALFAKACGFNSGKWIAGGAVSSIALKILFLTIY